ncbi:MAG TPA: hypothetical protein VJ955_00255 [Desulfuromonadales bacterium]|nr:hypothetical protein [Desulfuromonadales bacterium]
MVSSSSGKRLKFFIASSLTVSAEMFLLNASNLISKEETLMSKMKLALGSAGLALILLTGCTAQLSTADRNLLNQALEASKTSTVASQKAETASQKAEAAAVRAEVAANSAETMANRAETSARNAQNAAQTATTAAEKSQKAFEMGLKK